MQPFHLTGGAFAQPPAEFSGMRWRIRRCDAASVKPEFLRAPNEISLQCGHRKLRSAMLCHREFRIAGVSRRRASRSRSLADMQTKLRDLLEDSIGHFLCRSSEVSTVKSAAC